MLIANPGIRRCESVLEYASPRDFDEPLREIDGLRVVLGDVGRAFASEALVLASKHEHVYIELSTVVSHAWSLRRVLLEAQDMGVLDKLLFGSGFPRELPERAIANVYHVNGPALHASNEYHIPREQLRQIIERDSAKVLGIEHDTVPRVVCTESTGQNIVREVTSSL